jgi:hypothetical protein
MIYMKTAGIAATALIVAGGLAARLAWRSRLHQRAPAAIHATRKLDVYD